MKATTTDQATKVFSTLLAKFLENKDIKTYSSVDVTIRREGDGLCAIQVRSYIGGEFTDITSFTVCETSDLPEDVLDNTNF